MFRITIESDKINQTIECDSFALVSNDDEGVTGLLELHCQAYPSFNMVRGLVMHTNTILNHIAREEE